MKKALLPLLLTALFYADSLFVLLVPEQAFNGEYVLVPRFFLTGLLFVGVFIDRNTAIKYGFLFGLLFDMFYTGLLGAYFFFLPLLVYIASKLVKVVHSTLPVFFVIVLFDIALLELVMYGLNVLVQRTMMTFDSFVSSRLTAVLILNSLFYILFSYPLREACLKLKKAFQ